ncbi:hypothetical protein DPMN_094051 [Dreissena polymorpha]|uniref:Uncharacterized protein n=1 Tax=Dreissena polymorpha TaxID=45954 RepID=A0A9D4L5D0_DREPO|nr:hypothetical protein DPMN_094051 [Dreissena polymorpha]
MNLAHNSLFNGRRHICRSNGEWWRSTCSEVDPIEGGTNVPPVEDDVVSNNGSGVSGT